MWRVVIGSTLISHGHISVAPEEVPRKLSVDEIGGGVFERLFYGGGWVLFQGRCRCQKFKIIKLVRAGKLNRSIEKRLSILNHFNYSVYFLPGENNRNDYKEFRVGEKERREKLKSHQSSIFSLPVASLFTTITVSSLTWA